MAALFDVGRYLNAEGFQLGRQVGRYLHYYLPFCSPLVFLG